MTHLAEPWHRDKTKSRTSQGTAFHSEAQSSICMQCDSLCICGMPECALANTVLLGPFQLCAAIGTRAAVRCIIQSTAILRQAIGIAASTER